MKMLYIHLWTLDMRAYTYNKYVCRCMHVCMYVCTRKCCTGIRHACIYIQHVCIYACMYVCMYVHANAVRALDMRAYTYNKYVCRCMHVCMYVCTRKCCTGIRHACIYIQHIRMYACMYVCMHVCVYVHANVVRT
jgi:hypothetical protein